MRRREFIAAVIGGAVAPWSLVARAQQQNGMRRIGVLTILAEDDAQAKAWFAVFADALQRLGWELGRNISIDFRFAGGDDDRLRTYATELVEIGPDVLLANGPQALLALHQQVRSLPIVFVQVADPVKLGVVANLARPGGNITGFVAFEYTIASKWVQLLKDTVPGITRVAVMFDPENPFQNPYFQPAEAAASSFGMQLIRAAVRSATEIEGAITSFAQEPKGSLVVLPSAPTLIHRDLIIALADRHRLPTVYPYRVFATNGGFISYGLDVADVYRRAASYFDLILKGAKPSDLPVQLPTKYELVVNLKTAKALGLSLPERFLQSVDEVIE
jgi:putative ABC transport system substrate-binding protein